MTAGSVLATVAVLAWAAANTVGAFYVAWIAIGAAMALVLYEPAQVVLVKQFGAHATRAITTLTLVAGFASTIFQPLTAILADHLDWRTALVVLAVALAAVTIPIHLLVLPEPTHRPSPCDRGHCNRSRRDGTHAVTLLTDRVHARHGDHGRGHRPPHPVPRRPRLEPSHWPPSPPAPSAPPRSPPASPSDPTARRTSPARLAAGILGLPAVAVVVLALSDGGWTAWIAVGLLGVAQGTATLLRPMLLYRLHGPHGYGRIAATSAATTTIARATAPLVLAAIAAAAGYGFGFTLFALASVAAAALAARALTPDVSPSDTEHSLSVS